MNENPEEYSVCGFFPDGTYRYIVRWVDVETAVRIAKLFAQPGPYTRIIITDGGDCTCFEWIEGKGVTFPPQVLSK